MTYEDIGPLTPAEAQERLERGDAAELVQVPLAAALQWDDAEAAQEVCFELTGHPDETVRGNAVLALGHIARIHGKLDRAKATAVLRRAARDGSAYVRGQAAAAGDDIAHFLG